MKNKIPFSGNLKEKSYLLGLRAGDVHARKHHRLINAETTSTHHAQLKMFREAFIKYAIVKSYEKRGGLTKKTNRIYCYLDSSFEFLIKKPEFIPYWVLNDEELFYSFLAGYCDSEGSWIITQHKKYNGKWKDLIFSLGSCDKIILEQIHQKLKELEFNVHFYLVRKGNTETTLGLICKLPLYRVMIMKHKDVVRLASVLLPLSKHEEKQKAKIRIMNYDKMNTKRKFIKKKKLGTVKIPCIKCKHEKVWRNGSSRYKNKKYIRYKCPVCKKEFQRKER